MEDVDDHIGSAVQQNDVPPNQDVRAIGRRRWEPPLKILRTGLELFLESRWQRAAPHKLFFQSRGQLVSLGKSGRKVAPVFVIPSPNRFTVAILIVFTLIVIVSVLTMPLSVPVSVPLGSCQTAGKQKCPQYADNYPSCRSHCSLLIQMCLTRD